MNSNPSIGVERRAPVHRAVVPRRETDARPDGTAESGWLLEELVGRAMRFADRMTVLLRGEDARLEADFAAVGQALREGRIESAVQRHASIPWVIENDCGIGGLAVVEQRLPSVRLAADGLRRAMARLKVYSRYGVLPQI